MAYSTCIKCGNSSFEAVEESPDNSKYKFKLIFVQCSSCGGVVGVLDYYNIGNVPQEEREAIKPIGSHLNIHVDL